MVGQYPNYNYKKNSRPKCIALVLDYWNHIKFRTYILLLLFVTTITRLTWTPQDLSPSPTFVLLSGVIRFVYDIFFC